MKMQTKGGSKNLKMVMEAPILTRNLLHNTCNLSHLLLIELLATPWVKGAGRQPEFACRRGGGGASNRDRDRVEPDVLSCPFQKCPLVRNWQPQVQVV